MCEGTEERQGQRNPRGPETAAGFSVRSDVSTEGGGLSRPRQGGDYGMLFDTFVNRVLTFVPAPLMAATQRIEMRPASSAYSIRSWPCSSQINESMKFFIMYSSPFSALLVDCWSRVTSGESASGLPGRHRGGLWRRPR